MGGQSSAPNGLAKVAFWKAPSLRGNLVAGIGYTLVTAKFTGTDLTGTASARAAICCWGGTTLGPCEVVAAYFRSSGAIAGHATDGVGFNIRNVGGDGTGTDDLHGSYGYSTLTGADGAVSGSTWTEIKIDGPASSAPRNVYVSDSTVEGLEIQMTQLGAGQDLSGDTIDVMLALMVTSPGG